MLPDMATAPPPRGRRRSIEKPLHRRSFALPADLIERIEAASERYGVTAAAVVRLALERGMAAATKRLQAAQKHAEG